jgi:hypothetical protein
VRVPFLQHLDFDVFPFASFRTDLAKAMARTADEMGIRCNRKGSWVIFHEGMVRVRAFEWEERRAGSAGNSNPFLSVWLEVDFPDLFGERMTQRINQFAPTKAQALDQLAGQWLTEDFVALSDLIDGNLEGPHIFDIAAPPPQSELKRQGDWKVIMGPIWAYRSDGEQGCCPTCLMTGALTALDEELVQRSAFCVRVFANKGPDAHIEADCTLNGRDFPAGRAGVEMMAAKWELQPGDQEMRRQYMIFIPIFSDEEVEKLGIVPLKTA